MNNEKEKDLKKEIENVKITAVTLNQIPVEMHNIMLEEQLKRRKEGRKITLPQLYLEMAVKGLKSDRLL